MNRKLRFFYLVISALSIGCFLLVSALRQRITLLYPGGALVTTAPSLLLWCLAVLAMLAAAALLWRGRKCLSPLPAVCVLAIGLCTTALEGAHYFPAHYAGTVSNCIAQRVSHDATIKSVSIFRGSGDYTLTPAEQSRFQSLLQSSTVTTALPLGALQKQGGFGARPCAQCHSHVQKPG